jgi:hypothetical protein
MDQIIYTLIVLLDTGYMRVHCEPNGSSLMLLSLLTKAEYKLESKKTDKLRSILSSLHTVLKVSFPFSPYML